MSNAISSTGNRAAVAVCLLIGLGATGCPPAPLESPHDRSWSDRDSFAAEALKVDLPPDSRPDIAASFPEDRDSRDARRESKSRVWRDLLAGGEETGGEEKRGWIREVRQLAETGGKPRRRWRYPALEEMLNQESDQGVDPTSFLLAELAGENPDVATNAAIALTRLDNGSGMAQLVRAVGDSQRLLPMRCAAAEALGSLRIPSPRRDLRDLLARHGPPSPGRSRPYFPELHSALLRGLAGHVDPVAEPCFLLVLQTPFPLALHKEVATVKVDALGVLAAIPAAQLSQPARRAIVRSLNDGDPRVRVAALGVIGQAEYPGAYPHLSRGLRDSQADVRAAALAGLGRLGNPQSLATLEETLHHREAAMREAAVSALAAMRQETLVLEAAGDQSWRVRLAVARSIRRFPTPRAAAVALEMVDDRSSQVQREIVEAVRTWPLPMAGRVLLAAIAKQEYWVRCEAHAQLVAANWTPADDFDPLAPIGQRADDAKRLERLFREQIGFAPTSNALHQRPPLVQRVSAERLARVEPLLWRLSAPDTPRSVRHRAIADLVEVGPGLVDVLELIALERRQVLPEAVYRQVLPGIQTEFDLLDRLISNEVVLRRHAAGDLAELALDGPLGNLAVARLADVVVYESDSLVWQSVLRAIASDPREPAVRLAYAAAGHATSEVRRRACMHLAAHPARAHVPVLVPSLTDAKTAVACEAARALGLSGSPAAVGPLREQLARPNELLRVELALALARLGDRSGLEAMELLAYSPDETILRTVAISMGEIGDAAFIPSLIRMLDDRRSVGVAALASLPKVVGRDVAKSPDGQIGNFSERCEAWKRWYLRQRGGS